MSSTYRGICLNHTPALEFPHDSTYQNLGAIIRAWQLGVHEDITEHRACDVVFGAYSYPLYELYCPPNLAHDHVRPVAADPAVLREMLDDLNGDRGPLRRSAAKWVRTNRCWSLARLRALERILEGLR